MWLWKGLRYVFMDQASGGEGVAAAGGAAGSADVGAGAGAAAGAALSGADAGAGGAATGAGGGTPGAAGQGGTALQAGGEGQPAVIPEKYQVKKEDGSLDIEASSRKLAEAYGHLEKRLGSGELPPKAADEYQIAVPDALKDSWNPKEDPKLGEFLKNAHAKGMTQAQIDLVMQSYFDLAPQLVGGAQQLSEQECVADLRKEWKTDEQYKAEVGKAYRAAVAYGGDDAEAIIKDYGNDPRIVRMMSRIGAELGEDRSVNPGGSLPAGQTVEALMASKAYSDPKDPDHQRVSAQVKAYFDSQAAAAAKTGNVPLL